MSYNTSSGFDSAVARLLAWVDGIDLPMFVVQRITDERLQFLHVNDALGRVTGLPNDVFRGNTAAEIFPARVAQKLEGNYLSSLESDTPVSYEEVIEIDGRDTWWQTTLSKPSDLGGQVILGIAIPITERKEREFASVEAVADLQSRFEELQLFSTMAAHDARSPLATVSSLIELVLDDFNDMGDGKTELLRLCSNTVEEALGQITATLERGRGLNGTTSALTRVDLGRLCNDVAAVVDPEMLLDVSFPTGFVNCDEVVVQMGIRNLMTNAKRFCNHRIDVSVVQNGGELILDISDDGPGLEQSTTLADLTNRGVEREGAHGFGLASIDKILRSRGGRLELVHNGGLSGLLGACFRMTVPGEVLPPSGEQSSGSPMPLAAAI